MECSDADLSPHVEALYAGLRVPASGEEDRLRLARSADGRCWRGERTSGPAIEWNDPADALTWLDDELAVGLQRRRPDLLFVHAAAVARGEKVLLLAAESGGGKSTTTWAAMHHGFALLSDELAPVDPRGLLVHPYPRAICLKSAPPRPYDVPDGALEASGAFCIPTRLLPAAPAGALPLGAIAFVAYSPHDARPTLREIGPAESAARLYANSLNALAHGGEGLDAVAALSPRVRSFALRSGDLRATCELLCHALGA